MTLQPNDWRDQLRRRAIIRLSPDGACPCSEPGHANHPAGGRCGFGDTSLLEIDHVRGWPSEEVSERGYKITGARLYYRILATPEDEANRRWRPLCPTCHRYKSRYDRERGHLWERDRPTVTPEELKEVSRLRPILT